MASMQSSSSSPTTSSSGEWPSTPEKLTKPRLPALQPLAQSESKAKFMSRLNLDNTKEHDRRVYAMMKEEAIEGRKRLSSCMESPSEADRANPAVGPPYKNSQILETALHHEAMVILYYAREETRIHYLRGFGWADSKNDNWIIRWMLWHVFRYRDSRNKKRALQSQEFDTTSEDGHSVGLASPSPEIGHRYYDPIRNR